MTATRNAAPLALLLAGLAAAPLAAQSLEDELRDAARDAAEQDDFADQLVGLTGFATLPGIASANFFFDDAADTTIRRLNLPLARRFDSVEVIGGRLYGEFTLGYMDLDQDFTLDEGGPLATRVKSNINSFSAIAGLGVGYDLGGGTTLTPILMGGYTKIDDDADLRGPGAGLLLAATDEILLNFEIEEFVYGAALLVEHERSFANDVNMALDARYNHLFGRTISASDDVLEDETDFGVATASAVFDGPTGRRAFDRELRWIGFATGSYFPGLSSRALEMDYFVEIGAGLEVVDRGIVDGLEGASIRASGIWGDDLTGYTVGLHLEF